MEQLLAEYFLNSMWQLMLLAAGAWLLLRVLRPGPLVQHCTWLGVLALALALPLLSLHSNIAPHLVAAPPTSPAAALAQGLPAPILPSPRLHRNVPEEPLRVQPPIQTFTPPSLAVPPAAPTARIHWPPVREFHLRPSTSRLLVASYLFTILFAVVRLSLGWRAALRILSNSFPAQLSPAESRLVDQCCTRVGARRPIILESAAASSPMLVGIASPSLLLPTGLTNRTHESVDCHLEAVLLHELAHLRRRDCLANLIYRVAALPIAYHPVTWAISRRIRQSQEMLCDAIAADAMQSPVGYARCLVGLAQKMQPGNTSFTQIYGTAMFDKKVLEERVMRLIETKPAVCLPTRAVRVAGGVAIMAAALVGTSIFHLTPTLAQAPTSSAVQTAIPAPDNPMPAQASQPAQQSQPSQPSQSQPRAAARPAPAVQSAESAGPPTPTRAEMDDLQIRYDYAKRMYDAVVTRQADLIAHGDTAAASSADLKEQLNDARAQYENLSVVMEDAVQKHDEALQASLQNRDRQAQQAQWQAQIAEAQTRLNNPEWKNQIDDANSQIAKQMADAQAKLNSPEFKKQMADAQARFNNPEFQKRVADIQARFNSPEFKAKMQALSKQMADTQARINSPEFKKQMADIQARLNNPEFQKQMADLQVRFNSPEFKEQMQKVKQQIADAQALYEYQSTLGAQLQEVHHEIDDALKIWSEMETTPAPAAK